MTEIIDLSQEIFDGMPVFNGMPAVKINIYATHEEWAGLPAAEAKTPSVYKLELAEHTGTHVDALNHMGREFAGQSIDTMPLTMFYTEGVCLDFSHKELKALIKAAEIEEACQKANISIQQGDTVLFCTNHYQNYFGTENWKNGPGLSAESARWLGAKKIAAFGVETMSPGVPRVSNREVHQICGELGFTHYENLINLNKLVNRGRFRFYCFAA